MQLTGAWGEPVTHAHPGPSLPRPHLRMSSTSRMPLMASPTVWLIRRDSNSSSLAAGTSPACELIGSPGGSLPVRCFQVLPWPCDRCEAFVQESGYTRRGCPRTARHTQARYWYGA